jgi:hypothetical protein
MTTIVENLPNIEAGQNARPAFLGMRPAGADIL